MSWRSTSRNPFSRSMIFSAWVFGDGAHLCRRRHYFQAILLSEVSGGDCFR
jgi:hypothetical protein